MPLVTPPATLNSIPNLGSVLRNQGWSLINSMSCNLSHASQIAMTSVFSGSNGGTALVQEVSPASVSKIRLVYSNYWGNASPAGELAANNDLYVHAGVWNHSTQEAYPVFFRGEKVARVQSRQIAISDDIDFPVSANTFYDVRTSVAVTGPTLTLPTGYGINSGANGADVAGVEGIATDDASEGPFGMSPGSGFAATVYAHQAVLGFTGATPAKSLALVGDSIMDGTGDAGGRGSGSCSGWGVRIANQTFGVNVQYPSIVPGYGFVLLARGGDTIANFIAAGQNKMRRQVASLATTVLCNFGHNDLGGTLSAIKANYLTLAAMFVAQGQKFIGATILPNTSSSDNWRTLANQAVIGGVFETNRVALNTWFRDTTSSGFIAQLMAATGCARSMVDVFDACTTVEVNSSGAFAMNGGLWNVPAAGPVYTGAATTGGSGQWNDTGLPSTQNLYRGYVAAFTSGANAGSNAIIKVNRSDSKLVTSLGSLGSAISVGDAYSIYPDIHTMDGTHPSSWAHAKIAQSFPTSLIA